MPRNDLDHLTHANDWADFPRSFPARWTRVLESIFRESLFEAHSPAAFPPSNDAFAAICVATSKAEKIKRH